MVNIEAGVAEATVEVTAVKVITTTVGFFLPSYSRLDVQFNYKTFRQGSTSRSAVSPDHSLEGGMAVAF